MKKHLAHHYVWRQQNERSREQRNDLILVGELLLKRRNYLLPRLNRENPPPQPTGENWSRDLENLQVTVQNERIARDLENLQVLLHLEGQETEAVILEGGDEDRVVPFHAEILDNWEQFAKAQTNNQLEDFNVLSLERAM